MTHPLATFVRLLAASAALTAVLLYAATAGRATNVNPGLHCYRIVQMHIVGTRTTPPRIITLTIPVAPGTPGARCIGG